MYNQISLTHCSQSDPINFINSFIILKMRKPRHDENNLPKITQLENVSVSNSKPWQCDSLCLLGLPAFLEMRC